MGIFLLITLQVKFVSRLKTQSSSPVPQSIPAPTEMNRTFIPI